MGIFVNNVEQVNLNVGRVVHHLFLRQLVVLLDLVVTYNLSTTTVKNDQFVLM